MISARELEIFVYSAENLNLKIVAENLGVSQSVISKNISRLEEKIGFILFDRKARPLQLTPLGHKFYFKAFHVLAELKQLSNFQFLNENIQEVKTDFDLRVGIPHTLNSSLSPYIVDAFEQVEIVNGWGKSLILLLNDHEIDTAVILLPTSQTPDSKENWSLLGTVPLVIIGRKEMVREYKSLDDCNRTGWVLNPEGCGFRVDLNNRLMSQGKKLHIRHEIFGTKSQLDFVEKYEGIGLVPQPFFEYYNELNNTLAVLDIQDFRSEMYVFLVARPNVSQDKLSKVMEIIKQRFKFD